MFCVNYLEVGRKYLQYPFANRIRSRRKRAKTGGWTRVRSNRSLRAIQPHIREAHKLAGRSRLRARCPSPLIATSP